MGLKLAICVCATGRDEDSETPNLLSLPNEILVKIMSYLPDARDRVKFRYVSRRLRSISETPSLFYEFVWPDCKHHEESCLYNVMKDFGVHIRRLSFPQHLIRPSICPSTESQAILKLMQMMDILQFCSNLTHLSLPALDQSNLSGDGSDEQLIQSIQEMKHLEVLTIHCNSSLQPYLSLKTALKELTIYTVVPHSKLNFEPFKDWMMNGFNPPKLNIILQSIEKLIVKTLVGALVPAWSAWNSQIPAGHFAFLKVYINYKVPLNLFQNAPLFQLRYGEQLTLPLVHVDTDGWLLLTDHGDVNDSRVIHKARYYPLSGIRCLSNVLRQDCVLQLDNIVTSLTELDLSGYPFNFVQVIIACPFLRRLNLKNNSALRLHDLHMIASCCGDLEGLNLMNVPIPYIRSSVIALWEILSSMRKLAYLCIDVKYLGSEITEAQEELEILLMQCIRLKAFELSVSPLSYVNFSISYDNYKLLSYFPSLEYCRVFSDREDACVENILTACKGLKYFYCYCSAQVSMLKLHVNNLQQLCISSHLTDLDDRFMEAVSAHGGLVHVVFIVKSVNFSGMTTLINNSPNLLTCLFRLHEPKECCKWLSTELAKRFGHRKLFISGLSLVEQAKGVGKLVQGIKWLQNTDLLTLWLRPENFMDFPYVSYYI